jgi:hypothetical protein
MSASKPSDEKGLLRPFHPENSSGTYSATLGEALAFGLGCLRLNAYRDAMITAPPATWLAVKGLGKIRKLKDTFRKQFEYMLLEQEYRCLGAAQELPTIHRLRCSCQNRMARTPDAHQKARFPTLRSRKYIIMGLKIDECISSKVALQSS